MVALNMDLQVFVITNGRASFEYTMKTLENQSVSREIIVVRDMKWVDALNYCACNSSADFFLRVDDDMLLHPRAVEFFVYVIESNKKKLGAYQCKLWEEWWKKIAGSLKIYNSQLMKKMRFRASRLGKVDKTFRKDITKTSYELIKDGSVVGIHMLNSENDQIKYRNLWRDHNAEIGEKEFSQTFDNIVHPCNITLEEQYLKIGFLRKLNYRLSTRFGKWLRRSKN